MSNIKPAVIKLQGEAAALFRSQAEAATRTLANQARYLSEKERDGGWERGDPLIYRRSHRLDKHHELALFPKDPWFDEVRLVGEEGAALFRLKVLYRFKTSGMSGSEWRTSTMWQAHRNVPVKGDVDPDPRDEAWVNFYGGFGGMQAGCAALHPGIYRSQEHLWKLLIQEVQFVRKGRVLYGLDHDGNASSLLVTSAHLPWAWVRASDEPTGTEEAWADMGRLCMQAGCAQEAVCTYRLKRLYDPRAGYSTPAIKEPARPHWKAKQLVRRFCPLHLNRGDQDFEDCNDNYEVLNGPGPDEAVGWRQFESRARLMDPVYVDLGGTDGHE